MLTDLKANSGYADRSEYIYGYDLLPKVVLPPGAMLKEEKRTGSKDTEDAKSEYAECSEYIHSHDLLPKVVLPPGAMLKEENRIGSKDKTKRLVSLNCLPPKIITPMYYEPGLLDRRGLQLYYKASIKGLAHLKAYQAYLLLMEARSTMPPSHWDTVLQWTLTAGLRPNTIEWPRSEGRRNSVSAYDECLREAFNSRSTQISIHREYIRIQSDINSATLSAKKYKDNLPTLDKVYERWYQRYWRRVRNSKLTRQFCFANKSYTYSKPQRHSYSRAHTYPGNHCKTYE